MKILRQLLTLAFCLALFIAAVSGIRVQAEEAGKQAESKKPVVGELIGGFRVDRISRYDVLCADVYEFTHERTGAKAIWVDNGKIERGFSIFFGCPDEDDYGTKHVVEHLCHKKGSDRYPLEEIVIQIISNSYATAANAYSIEGGAFYPVWSLSEAQLLRFEDTYVDSVLFPRALKDDGTEFHKEAWRYEIGGDGELTYSGVVYNEMKSSYDISTASLCNLRKSIFEDGNYFYYGGIPEEIPNLTFEMVKDYHDRYYVPSNSTSYFVGTFDDIAPFLKVLDKEFESFDDTEVVIGDREIIQSEKLTTRFFEYPAARGTDATNSTVIRYGIMTDKDADASVFFGIIDYLDGTSSELKRLFSKKLPKAKVKVGADILHEGNLILITVNNVDRSDTKQVKKLIKKALRKIERKGFNPNLLRECYESTKLDTVKIGEGIDAQQKLLTNLNGYCDDDGMIYLNLIEDSVERYEENYTSGRLGQFFKSQVTDNKRRAVAVTVPVPGLTERKNDEQKAKLSAIRESLTPEELQKIKNLSQELEKDMATEQKLFRKLINVTTVETITDETKKYEIHDSIGEKGVRFIETEAGPDNTIKGAVLIDMGGLPQELIPYMVLYIDLLGSFGCENLTREQLYSGLSRNLASYSFDLDFVDDNSERGYMPYLECDYMTTGDKLQEALDVIGEIIGKPVFDDTETVKYVVSRLASSLKQIDEQEVIPLLSNRSNSVDCQAMRWFESCYGITHIQACLEIEKQLENDPQSVIDSLMKIRRYINDNPATIVIAAGGKTALAENREAVYKMIGEKDCMPIGTEQYYFEEFGRSEAIVLDTDVNCNLIGISWAGLGEKRRVDELRVITNVLEADLLFPTIRYKNGAYAAWGYVTISGMNYSSISDPMIKETFDCFASIPDFLRNLRINKASLDEFKLSVLSGLLMPGGDLSDGKSACLNYLRFNNDPDVKSRAIEAVRNLKPKDIRKYVGYYDIMVENGYRGTVASREMIEANRDLYDNIIDIYGER